MFSHVVVGSNDIERSRKFYDAVFGVMGVDPAPQGERLFYRGEGPSFIVTKPIDGQPACHANGGTIGFAMKDEAMVKAWHDAGVANGGTSIEDPPGVREPMPGLRMCLAYLRDPDGNKLCAMKMLG